MVRFGTINSLTPANKKEIKIKKNKKKEAQNNACVAYLKTLQMPIMLFKGGSRLDFNLVLHDLRSCLAEGQK